MNFERKFKVVVPRRDMYIYIVYTTTKREKKNRKIPVVDS